MLRKLTALVAATLVAFALLPAVAATAEVNSSATLLEGAEVFPGGGQAYLLQVSNDENPILGLGRNINRIRVTLPPNLRNPQCPDPSDLPAGFTCTERTPPGVTGFVFDGLLMPGQTADLPFTVDVIAPTDRDRVQQVRVEYSEDAGITYDKIADLDTAIRILQLIPGTLREVDPAGFPSPNRGTAGQTLTIEFAVRNHAQQTVTVTPTLDSDDPGDTVTALTPTLDIPPAGGEATATFTFTSPDAATRLRDVVVTADATAPGADAPDTDNTAVLQIEGPPHLALDPASFSDPVVSSGGGTGRTYRFTIEADKLNLPAVTGLSGSITLTGPQTLTAALDAPDTLPRPERSDLLLQFAPVTVTAADPSGSFDATFAFTGSDDNGQAFSQTVSLPDLVELDNLAPDVTLDLALPDGQVQAKEGDVVTISGEVAGGDVALPDDLTLSLVATGDGEVVDIPVPAEDVQVDGTAFTVDVTVEGTATYDDVTGFFADGIGTGTLTATATAADTAGNVGGDAAAQDLDNIQPFMRSPARVIRDADYDPDKPVVEVVWDNNFPALVAGACLPTQYEVDEAIVLEVRYSDGSRCQPGQASPAGDNTRILVLDRAIDPDVPRNVDYVADALGLGVNDPAVDGARNEAVDQTVRTISGVAPPLPQLINVTRSDTDSPGGREDATFAEDRYWTNVGGDADDPAAVLAFVGGAKSSYVIQVLDGDGTVLHEAQASGADDTIRIPLPDSVAGCTGAVEDDDCVLERALRFFNPSAVPGAQVGPALDLEVVLDQTDPTLAGAAMDSPEQVTVTLSEVLHAGRNVAEDWYLLERNPDPDSGAGEFFVYGAQGVSGSGATRTLDADLPGNGPFAGVGYRFFGSDPLDRYEDYAGNRMADGELLTG